MLHLSLISRMRIFILNLTFRETDSSNDFLGYINNSFYLNRNIYSRLVVFENVRLCGIFI
jgi:hypothetical protein